MRKNSRKISLAILALTAVSLGAVATGNLSLRTAAEGINTLDTFRLENVSVRLKLPDEQSDNGGFRFESLISQDTYDGLTNVTEVGTLFTITDMSEDALVMGANNVAKIVLEGTVGEENRRGGEKTTDDEGVAVISYRAFINDIPDTDFDTDVMARSYVIANGDTYYTNVVTQSVGDVARTAYYDVKEESNEDYTETVQDGWYSPFNAAQREEIGAYITTTEKTYEDQYVLVENGAATLDLSQLSVDESDVIGFMVDGAFTSVTKRDSALTYTTTVGEKTLTVATTDGVYDVALAQADNVITTGDEFYNWTNNWGSYQYTVLANDLTAKSGTHWINGGAFPDGYIFNGLGHTIDGFTRGKGIVHALGSNSVWKNVNYTNYSGDLVLYAAAGGVFENVNVTGTISNTRDLLAYTINSGSTTVKNSIFNIKHTVVGTPLVLATKGTNNNQLTLIDTEVIYRNGQLTGSDELDLSKGSNYSLYSVEKTDYYAKIVDGVASFPISQMGEENVISSVSKLLVNDVVTTATIADGVLSYPASGFGLTTLIMETDKGDVWMNITQADNVITTWEEFKTWGGDDTNHNQYEYTVLANNITHTDTETMIMKNFYKTFDGLGHTIIDFKAYFGITREMQAGATWKNVNYTGLQGSEWGILGRYLKGGTFENVHIEGEFTVGDKGFLSYGFAANGTTINNCSFTITSDPRTDARYLVYDGAHYYTCTISNTTIAHCNGIKDYTWCECTGTYGCNGKATKTTIKKSTINGTYVENHTP